MKTCPKCQAQLNDDAIFCTSCGTQFANTSAPQAPQQPQFQQYVPYYNPYDHTAEFDAKDISENKVISMLVYLMGVFGIIIALLIGKESPYTAFHVRQSLKFMVVEILMGIATALLFWTIIVPIAYGIMSVVLLVLKIICFFQICSGKAIEPPIIRNLGFLK